MKKNTKLPKDPNKRALEIVLVSTEEENAPETTSPEQPPEDNRSEISKYLSAIGKKGGLIGGKVRNDSLTPERRKEIAKDAAKARWDKQKPKNK